MKINSSIQGWMKRITLSVLTMILFLMELSAQTPTHYPTGRDKVDWSFINVLIYIIFPVVLILVWILIRRSAKKKEEKEEKEKE